MDTVEIIVLHFSMTMVAFTVSTVMIYTCGWTCYVETYKALAWLSSFGFVVLNGTKNIDL
jgi:hypothetical protein